MAGGAGFLATANLKLLGGLGRTGMRGRELEVELELLDIHHYIHIHIHLLVLVQLSYNILHDKRRFGFGRRRSGTGIILGAAGVGVT
jgi:hypothetical protein